MSTYAVYIRLSAAFKIVIMTFISSFILNIYVAPLQETYSCNRYSIHAIIHSGYFYSTFSNPLLLRGTSNTAWILCWRFTPKRHRTASEGLAQGPYVAARVRFEHANRLTQCTELTNEPPHPTNHQQQATEFDVLVNSYLISV